jgi:hypothetical protein
VVSACARTAFANRANAVGDRGRRKQATSTTVTTATTAAAELTMASLISVVLSGLALVITIAPVGRTSAPVTSTLSSAMTTRQRRPVRAASTRAPSRVVSGAVGKIRSTISTSADTTPLA